MVEQVNKRTSDKIMIDSLMSRTEFRPPIILFRFGFGSSSDDTTNPTNNRKRGVIRDEMDSGKAYWQWMRDHGMDSNTARQVRPRDTYRRPIATLSAPTPTPTPSICKIHPQQAKFSGQISRPQRSSFAHGEWHSDFQRGVTSEEHYVAVCAHSSSVSALHHSSTHSFFNSIGLHV